MIFVSRFAVVGGTKILPGEREPFRRLEPGDTGKTLAFSLPCRIQHDKTLEDFSADVITCQVFFLLPGRLDLSREASGILYIIYKLPEPAASRRDVRQFMTEQEDRFIIRDKSGRIISRNTYLR